MFLKVIACEIALREICHLAGRSPNLLDLQFLSQGHHDHPLPGRAEIQQCLDAVPAGRYDAILLGYGLCSNMLVGLGSSHTRMVIPRAHDCITWFLGSKERYQAAFTERPGTYYFTSGWLECPVRRGQTADAGAGAFIPSQANAGPPPEYAEWVRKYGEEQARYLVEEMARWARHYTHGALIDFPFTRSLRLAAEVRRICAVQGWNYTKMAGNLSLLRRWLDGDWGEEAFLVVPAGRRVVATFDETIIGLAPEPDVV